MRAVLRVEALEGRFQPSLAALPAALPEAGVPFDTASLVAPGALPTVIVSDFTPLAGPAVQREFSAPLPHPAGDGPHRRELLLVEFDVPDRDDLVRDILAQPQAGTDLQVVEIRGGGVTEITSVLRGLSGLDAIHLISHGSAGSLDLGATQLDSGTLAASASDLRTWGAALKPGGDLLLYGCAVAAGDGRGFVAQLSSLTGADVAASTDETGSPDLGGNWRLEFSSGLVNTATLSAPRGAWEHVLDAKPKASNDGYATPAGVALNVPAAGVLANDDAQGVGPLTATLTNNPTSGSVVLNPDGSFTYTPNGGFQGTDDFQYKAVTAAGPSNTGHVYVTVGPGNAPPVANDDDYAVAQGSQLVLGPPGVLGNDADANGDHLTASGFTAPAHGTLTGTAADGKFTYTPSAGYSGPDSFTYTVGDGKGGTATGTVTITVTPAVRPGVSVVGDTFLVAADNAVYRVNALTGMVVATVPTGLANDGATFAPDGSLYVADYYGKQIRHYSASGALLGSFGTNGTTPQGLAFGPDGNLYVTTTNSTVERYSPTGTNHATFIAAGSGGLNNAKAVVWGADGTAYVSSYGNSRVLRYDGTTGAFLNVFATGTGGFEDITFGPDGDLYAASYGDGKVYRYRGADGAALGAFVTGVTSPYGLRFDPNGNLAVSSRSTGQIRTYDGTTGAFLGVLASGLPNPSFLTTTAALVTTTAGGTAAARLALTTRPTADVTVSLTMTAPGQGALSRTTLTFTPADWNVPQTVTVTGLDDRVPNGDQAYRIDGTTLSADAAYNGLALASVPVLNREIVVPNRPPLAAADAYATAEDTPLTLAGPGVLANDTDPDGDPLTATVATLPAHGSLSFNADGSFTYVPAANYNGPDSFTYTVGDGRGGTAIGTVSLTVTPVNDPPVAADDIYTTAVNLVVLSTPLSVAAPGVLGNDTDADLDPLTAQLVTGPANGLFSFNADGSFTYTAVLNFSGTDSFTYRVTDGTAWSAPATVFINVSAPNRAPTAAPDGFTTTEDTPLVVPAGGLLANDADPDGDTLAAVVDRLPAFGALTPNANGGFTYTPAADWSGTDSFTYHATDGSLSSASVTVTLTVSAVNDAPTLDPITDQFVAEDAGPVMLTLTGITAGAGESQPLTVTARSSDGLIMPDPVITYASPATSGLLTFNPVRDANGSVTVTVTVSDGVTSTSRAFAVIVTPVNDPPVAVDDRAATAAGRPVVVDVLGNDSDPDGDLLTVVAVGLPSHGSTATDGTTVTYTPAVGWSGTDTFTYTVTDGNGGVASATVTVTVLAVNAAPVAARDSYSTTLDTSLSVAAGGVLANDADADGDVLAAALVTGPANGNLTLNADGSFTYTPDPGYVGTDSFDYRVTDGGLFSAPITVTVVVSNPPTPTPQPQPTPTSPGSTTATSPATGAASTPTATPAAPTTPAAPAAPTGFGSPLPAAFAAATPAGTVAGTVVATPTTLAAVGTTISSDHGSYSSYGGQVFAPDAAAGGAMPDAAAPPPSLPPDPKPVPAATPAEVAGPAVPPPTPPVILPPTAPAATVAAPAPDYVPSEAVLASIDRARADLRADAAARATTDTIVVSGGVAVAGYVLLNTRAVYWFLGALLARPAVWRRFDPLEVVYAWEREGGGRRAADPDSNESLQSIVG